MVTYFISPVEQAFNICKKISGILSVLPREVLLLILSGLLIIILFYPTPGLTEVVNLTPVKDTFINKSRPTRSFEGRRLLRTRANTNSVRETLAQFSLSGIPQGSLILNAELKLFNESSEGFSPDAATRVYANLDSWSGSTTWNTRPPRASSFEDSIRVTSTGRYFSWDVTDLVQDWVDGVETNYGVRVRSEGGGNLFFRSREIPSKSPILHVEYAPASYVGFGDSITKGAKDDISSDNCSDDGRNCGGGYEPILNNLLTQSKGYAHTVLNEGVGGNTSIDGANRISNVLSARPRSQFFLILFGTNEASSIPPLPSGVGLKSGDPGYAGSYKDNMQQIITAIIGAGKEPFPAKVPILYAPCGSSQPFPNPDQAPQNVLIRDYNRVINELVSANSIQVVPPDFYNYFRSHPEEIADFCHPNGVGYQSMANLWLNALVP